MEELFAMWLAMVLKFSARSATTARCAAPVRDDSDATAEQVAPSHGG